jgi:tRNA uridine 5-carboxymethylaminomethyl modification enzyme
MMPLYPLELKPTLETKKIKGLYLAVNQWNLRIYRGSCGPGFDGRNQCVLKLRVSRHLSLAVNEAYIGESIDDLISHGWKSPIAFFTSRAEYRSDLRLEMPMRPFCIWISAGVS